MLTSKRHPDIISGKTWPESMDLQGSPTGDNEWYIERYRDGRVLLNVNSIFTADEWQAFVAEIAKARGES